MEIATILAVLKAATEIAKAAPGIIDQAHKLLGSHDDAELKAVLAETLAAYEDDHARVIEKLRAAARP